MERTATLSGVAHDTGVARITIAGLPSGPATLARVFTPLAQAELSVDVIAESTGPDGALELGFTVGEEDLDTALAIVERTVGSAARVAAQPGLAKVALVGTGMLNRPGYAARLFAALARADVACLMVSTSEISVTCVVPREQVEPAVRRIHATFRDDFVANPTRDDTARGLAVSRS